MTTDREDTTMPSWDDVKPGDRIDCHYERPDGSISREENAVCLSSSAYARNGWILDAIRRPEPQYPEVGTMCYLKWHAVPYRTVGWRVPDGWAHNDTSQHAAWNDAEIESWEPVPLVPKGHITIPRPSVQARVLRFYAGAGEQYTYTATILRTVADAMDAQS